MSLAGIRRALEECGYAAVEARNMGLPLLEPERQALTRAWGALVQDLHMGDSGTYRYRRYSRFLLNFPELELLEGNSIFQNLHDNPLNGGSLRTFAPLEADHIGNPFLQGLIRRDAELLGLTEGRWAVGVHFLRIVARPDSPGHPAPEGVHLDSERFTVQHLIERENVRGGVFSAYDAEKMPIFHWLQLKAWDSVFFTGSTWHSASPIEVRDPAREGHRDIILIDFDLLEPEEACQ